jgi:hypothetical protein
MTDPVLTPAASTLAAATATVPLLSVAGISLGLRPDVLVAGFFGALVAIILLDSVPVNSDTWREMLRGSLRRMMVSLASSVVAGYTAPVLAYFARIPDPLLLGLAFVIGAGAQKVLAGLVNRAAGSASGKEG